MVVNAPNDRAALTKATRIGRRFYGAKFLGAVSALSFFVQPGRRA